MRGLVFILVAAAAVFAVGFSAPANQELAEMEKFLTEAKNSRVADQSSNEVTKKVEQLEEVEMERQWDYPRFPVASEFPQTSRTASKKNKEKTAKAENWNWTFEHPFKSSGSGKEKRDPENNPWGSYHIPTSHWKEEKMAEKEQMPLGASFSYYSTFPQASGKEEVEKKAEKEQWGGSSPFHSYGGYPQASLRRGKEKVEKKAEKEQWRDYNWPTPRGSEKKAEEELAKEQWRSSQVHRNSSLRYNRTNYKHMKNGTVGGYLDSQMDRMRDFLKAQTKRMQDYINLTTTFVRYEKNKTLDFMRRERNITRQFQLHMQRKQKAPRVERNREEKAEAEIWTGSGYGYYQQSTPPQRPPSTNLRETTAIRIPTYWEKDAMEVARIQGFLRKIAPFILRKISG